MKKIAVLLMAGLPLIASAQTEHDVAEKMIKFTSRAMYIDHYCGVKIDRTQFKQVAKIFAFSEGMDIQHDRINWETLIIPAREEFKEYAKQYPDGERCEVLLKRAEGILPFVEKDFIPKIDLHNGE